MLKGACLKQKRMELRMNERRIDDCEVRKRKKERVNDRRRE